MTDPELHWVERRKLAPWLRNAPGVGENLVAAAEDDEGEYRLAAWCRYSDGEPEITIGVFDDDGTVRATTDDSHDWPAVEESFPRELWPSEMYVGVRGPAEHEAPGDLRSILDREIHQYRTGIVSEIADRLYRIARDLGYRPQPTDWIGGPDGTDTINGIILGENCNDHVCELYASTYDTGELVLADPNGAVLWS